MKTFSALLLAALLGAAIAVPLSRRWQIPPKAEAGAGRKVLFYQSPMHPWIKADKPGLCTICGMKLVPVYEGENGAATDFGIVALSSNAVTALGVETTPVARRGVVRRLKVSGRIDDDDTRHRVVSAYVDGRIDELGVDHVGQDVVQGQRLALLYSPPLLAAERDYATLVRGKADAGLAAAASSRLARMGLNAAQIAGVPSKKPDDSHSELLSPQSGTVVSRFVYAGQYVREGDKLFEIADFSTMWFLFNAGASDLAWITPGQRVVVNTDSAPGKDFEGVVAFIDPNFDETTRTTRVRVELPNPALQPGGGGAPRLFHRSLGQGTLEGSTPPSLALPREAVLMHGARPVVYVEAGGGGYERREVRVGRVGDADVEIVSGVEEGEKVVTRGNLLIDAEAALRAPSPTGGETNQPMKAATHDSSHH